jgi:hypothetical protein
LDWQLLGLIESLGKQSGCLKELRRRGKTNPKHPTSFNVKYKCKERERRRPFLFPKSTNNSCMSSCMLLFSPSFPIETEPEAAESSSMKV